MLRCNRLRVEVINPRMRDRILWCNYVRNTHFVCQNVIEEKNSVRNACVVYFRYQYIVFFIYELYKIYQKVGNCGECGGLGEQSIKECLSLYSPVLGLLFNVVCQSWLPSLHITYTPIPSIIIKRVSPIQLTFPCNVGLSIIRLSNQGTCRQYHPPRSSYFYNYIRSSVPCPSFYRTIGFFCTFYEILEYLPQDTYYQYPQNSP